MLEVCEGVDERVGVRGLGWVAGAEGEKGIHAGFTRGVEFADDVGNEEDFRWLQVQLFRNATITLRIGFLADIRIEVMIDKPAEIACFAVFEKKVLGQHTARRKNIDTQTRSMPALKRRRHVRKDLRLQRPVEITLPPDLSL